MFVFVRAGSTELYDLLSAVGSDVSSFRLFGPLAVVAISLAFVMVIFSTFKKPAILYTVSFVLFGMSFVFFMFADATEKDANFNVSEVEQVLLSEHGLTLSGNTRKVTLGMTKAFNESRVEFAAVDEDRTPQLCNLLVVDKEAFITCATFE